MLTLNFPGQNPQLEDSSTLSRKERPAALGWSQLTEKLKILQPTSKSRLKSSVREFIHQMLTHKILKCLLPFGQEIITNKAIISCVINNNIVLSFRDYKQKQKIYNSVKILAQCTQYKILYDYNTGHNKQYKYNIYLLNSYLLKITI